ncbi:hypothetical protein PYW07_015791 [Mythimna separata]|uniref:Uncharacterized protein n=1 Tax=Mythimna separata TaxID=271217 RepID=A0AAD7YPZ6_MYTSE|nr:hypothetical protein PYW07_015791 [Mythimna separata]
MLTKLLLVLAAVCVVKASVFADNVFDENDPEVASDPRQCIPRECKRQCHRQGYGNGLCIAGQCRCRRVFAAQVNDPETEVENNPRQCIPSNCKAACRRQGFGNGYCVAGQCRCTALKAQVDDAELFNLEDLVSLIENDPETEVARNPLKCDDAKCNRKCRDKGFARGGCYLGRCKCRRN